jgi:hypothetical protein
MKRSNDLLDVVDAAPSINGAVEEIPGVATVPVPGALISPVFPSSKAEKIFPVRSIAE